MKQSRFDGVFSPISCLPKLNTRIDHSQYEIKHSSHNFGTNQSNNNLINNNLDHNSVWLNPIPRCLASHCYKIKQIKVKEIHKQT